VGQLRMRNLAIGQCRLNEFEMNVDGWTPGKSSKKFNLLDLNINFTGLG
jgi:hypothetical protein